MFFSLLFTQNTLLYLESVNQATFLNSLFLHVLLAVCLSWLVFEVSLSLAHLQKDCVLLGSSAPSLLTPCPRGAHLWPCIRINPLPRLITWIRTLSGWEGPRQFHRGFPWAAFKTSLGVLFTPVPPQAPTIATSLSSRSLLRTWGIFSRYVYTRSPNAVCPRLPSCLQALLITQICFLPCVYILVNDVRLHQFLQAGNLVTAFKFSLSLSSPMSTQVISVPSLLFSKVVQCSPCTWVLS